MVKKYSNVVISAATVIHGSNGPGAIALPPPSFYIYQLQAHRGYIAIKGTSKTAFIRSLLFLMDPFDVPNPVKSVA